MMLSPYKYRNLTISWNTNIHCGNNLKMKINIHFIFFSLFLITLFENAQSGLVIGFVEKIHDSIHKVHEDVHNLFRPKENNNKNLSSDGYQRENQDNKPPSTVATNIKQDNNEKIIFADVDDTRNEKSMNNNNSIVTPADIGLWTTTDKTGTTEEILIFSSSPSTPSPLSTTTKKEGRENFAAGCSTGYKRTPDGRCKPTF